MHDKLLKEKFGVGRRRRKSKKPEAEAKPSDSASVPVAARAEVYQRDGGACTYVDPETGQRCGERRWLQLDHIVAAVSRRDVDPYQSQIAMRES